MSKLIAVARNVIQTELSEKSSLIFFIVLPVLFTVIIGMGLGGSSDADGSYLAPIGIIDLDGSSLSRNLVDILARSEVVSPRPVALTEVDELLRQDTIVAALLIPSGFEDALLDGEPADVTIKASANTGALAAREAVEAAVNQVSSAVTAAFASVAEFEIRQAFSSQDHKEIYFREGLDMARDLLASPVLTTRVSYPVQVNKRVAGGYDQGSAGQLVTWVLITLLGAGESFVSERLGGTFRRLIITPTSKAVLIGGKILGWLAIGIVQMAILIGFGALFLGVDWGRSPVALAGVAFSFGLAAVSLGVLMGTFAKTRSQAGSMITLVGMALSALGGAWWPLEITPPVYQTVVKALPTTWAMLGFGNVILRGQDLQAVLPEIGVLLGFATVFFTAGFLRLRFD